MDKAKSLKFVSNSAVRNWSTSKNEPLEKAGGCQPLSAKAMVKMKLSEVINPIVETGLVSKEMLITNAP